MSTNWNVFVWDRQTQTTTEVSRTTGIYSWGSISISADGRYITYDSATNLVPDTNGSSNVFVWDRLG